MEFFCGFVLILTFIAFIVLTCRDQEKQEKAIIENNKIAREEESIERQDQLKKETLDVSKHYKYENSNHSIAADYILCEMDKKIYCSCNSSSYTSIDFNKILGTNVIAIDGKSNDISNAVTGGIVFGIAGAVIGSQIDKKAKIKSYKLQILLSDPSSSLYTFDLIDDFTEFESIDYIQATEFVSRVSSSINAIIKSNKDSQLISQVVNNKDSIEQRLKSLDSLKQSGTISDEEYNTKRKEILDEI